MRGSVLLVSGLMVAGAATCLSLEVRAGVSAEATPAPTPRSGPEANQVTFFQGRQFKGDSMTLQAGDEIPNLNRSQFGSWADRIKSIEVGADTVVVMWVWFNYGQTCWVFRGANAGGGTGRYADLSKYGNLAIKTKSVKVFLKTYPERICQPH